MDAIMKSRLNRLPLSCVALLLLAAAGTAGAQNIYKCTHGGQLSYTDHPCPKGEGELLHQADDTEVIDRYLRLGQDTLAKSYASSRNLDALYQQRIEARQQAQDEKAQQQADDAYAAQQQAEQQRQQNALDEVAERNRLQGENDALREQNATYQDQLQQEASRPAPVYVMPYVNHRPRRDRDGGRDAGHGHPRPSQEPVVHLCKQLAGGRTEC